jgi:plasmid maintenance system antidote protein VapI
MRPARQELRRGGKPTRCAAGLRLCRCFGLSDGWWPRLQADYDTAVAKADPASTLAKIRPWRETTDEAS